MKKFKYCPNCKSKIESTVDYYKCKNCDFILYKHSHPTGSAFVVKDDKVLLAIRGRDPLKGMVDIGGGFCNHGEHPKETAVRELFEETTLRIRILDLVGIYMDEYDFKGSIIKTLNMVYVAETLSGSPKPKDDVESLDWYDILDPPFNKIAFEHQKIALQDLQKWHAKNN